MPDGRGIAIRDDRGWNNIWIDDVPLVDEQFEHAQPSWGLGQRSFAVAPDGLRVAFSRNESGFGRLCAVDVETKVIREVGRGVHGQLSWVGERVCALRSGARTPTQIVLYDTNSWERTVVAIGPVAGWESVGLTEPELIEVASSLDGCTLFTRLYRATADTGRLLIFLHGGPTDQWMVTFMPRVAYWQSRGWHVLVPDHRGSSGHGRVYQQAMNARWGDLDAADTIEFARHAQVAGLATPQRTALMGGSAGGFTVLNALAREPNIAAAAVVSYPVCDLYDLNIRSHRFELHYNLNLVGPHPSSADAPGPYRDRSPIHFAQRLVTPLLIHHGDADPVVPIDQSRALVGELRARAADVIFHEYAGEGHGLRQPVNQLLEYERSEAFLNNHVPAARHLAE